jgi:hypothetical protein
MEDDHGSIQWDKVFRIKKTKLLKISNLDDKITVKVRIADNGSQKISRQIMKN